MEVRIYGQSDDNVYMDSDEAGFGDQFNGWEKTCTILFESKSTGESVVVTAQHCSSMNGFNGTWSIGLTLQDDEYLLPNWGFRFEQENYSPMIVFNAPSDVIAKCTSDGEERN